MIDDKDGSERGAEYPPHETSVLAEVLAIAVPGSKMPHIVLAARIELMLRKRGVLLIACRAAVGSDR